MLLGTPVISSDVGGVRSILEPTEEGIVYRWNDAEALSKAVVDVFANPTQVVTRAKKARVHAQKTHDAENNFSDLLTIYDEIYKSCNKPTEG